MLLSNGYSPDGGRYLGHALRALSEALTGVREVAFVPYGCEIGMVTPRRSRPDWLRWVSKWLVFTDTPRRGLHSSRPRRCLSVAGTRFACSPRYTGSG